MKTKRIKDPIYGYIEIDSDVCARYIDTPEFQRLRRITQTSYAPLYPSALHSRFVHSLGVYYLGHLAVNALSNSIKRLFSDNSGVLSYWEKASRVFELACLLHDFGHSPFSHTGEKFYDSENNRHLDERLADLVDNAEYRRDYKEASSAANHEIMSAIIAIEKHGDDIDDIDLFARCITGYKHKNPLGIEQQINNVLISMLNSSTIDVDRMDYLIRDAFVVGYDSITIDYIRLLSSLDIIKLNDDYLLAYRKSALSVLENVIYGRDLEKKWIQSHPIVMYEQFLVGHAISVVNDHFECDNCSLFSREALSVEGVRSSTGQLVRLMSDDDIVFLAKNNCADELIDEYFNRAGRRHPIWKSEAEFDYYFPKCSERKFAIDALLQELDKLVDCIEQKGSAPVLNEDLLNWFKEQQDIYNQKIDDRQDGAIQYREQARAYKDHISFLSHVKDLSEEYNVHFDFVLLQPKRFSSGFSSNDLSKVMVTFDEGYPKEFGELSGKLSSTSDDRTVFYLFHHAASNNDFPDKKMFVDRLISFYIR